MRTGNISIEIDSKAIDANAEIPKETLQGLKDLGLFGLQVPEQYGGLNLNATECTRIGEITSLDGGIAVTLAAHQSIGYKGILLFGTDLQKEKYLPKLASGEHTAAFCLTEPLSGSDAASITTKAALSKDGTHYLLNGGKIWISNGGTADIFTVFAKTIHENDEGKVEEKVTAFIVERAFGGVTNGKPEDKLGIRGSNTCEVYFDNTPVPIENVIDEPGKGFKVAMNILNSGRFSMGGAIAGIIKHLIKPAAEHAINRSQFKTQLKDFPLIQEKFTNLTINTYVMESMSYLTAGLIDSQTDSDCSVEAAIVKVFSSEAGFNCENDCIQILGGMGYMKDYCFERYMRDGRIAHIFEGTNEILRLFISLSGLQHISGEMKEMVKKLRNPLLNPGFTFGVIKNNVGPSVRRFLGMDPKLDLDLQGSAHPSLRIPCNVLEASVKQFQFAVQKALSDHGAVSKDLYALNVEFDEDHSSGIQSKQLTLKRIADIAIDIYAMTAIISRASRSCVIGLRNSEVELRIVNVFVSMAKDRIDKNYDEIIDGPFSKMDIDTIKIAEAVFKNSEYPLEHPLKKNLY
ncbi:Acyl-CoA dehydrogenase family member 9, mitochondrial [Nymphon striatum]|nr:Acyl-CoA dehydrogenase family member 9, mitochondrial [Nymphon striatum]